LEHGLIIRLQDFYKLLVLDRLDPLPRLDAEQLIKHEAFAAVSILEALVKRHQLFGSLEKRNLVELDVKVDFVGAEEASFEELIGLVLETRDLVGYYLLHHH